MTPEGTSRSPSPLGPGCIWRAARSACGLALAGWRPRWPLRRHSTCSARGTFDTSARGAAPAGGGLIEG